MYKAIVFFVCCLTAFFRNKLGSEDEIKIKNSINLAAVEKHDLTPELYWHGGKYKNKIEKKSLLFFFFKFKKIGSGGSVK